MKFFLFAITWLAMTWCTTGTAQAAPEFQIVGIGGGTPSANAESIGDNGGTTYPSAPNAGAFNGAGLPTAQGSWPNNFPAPGTNPPGFAIDTGLPPGGGKYGISGFDASYLRLTEPGTVTFQFMGKGDATDRDQFQLFLGGSWVPIWDNKSASNGTCGAAGVSTPVITCSFAGSSVSYNFPAGYIPFRFVNLTTPPGGAIATNDGTTGNPSPDKPPYPSGPGYFLGVDPYLATGQYDTTGQVVYAGFTDRGFTAAGVGDHDYEDLIVRMSVSGGTTAIPTLSEWSMIILSSLLALGALLTLRRQRQ